MPSWVAFAVTGLLEQHFGRLVDYGFTAAMEDELDEIAAGNERRTNWLNNFYFGGEHGVPDSIARSGGLKKLVGVNLEGIDAREVNSIKLFDDEEGRPIYVRVGKNGPYLERMVAGDDGEPKPQRANLNDSLTPDELTLELAEKLFSTPQEGRSLGVDPETGHEVVAKDGRYGPYVTEVLPEPERAEDGLAGAKKGKKPTGPKPRTGSLLRSMALDTVTLDDALRLLSLPRVVGVDPNNGEEITAQNGRYGPYLKRGTDSRSLATEEQMFDITLDEALKIYSEPKRRAGQRASTPPLRELGNDPATGKPMVIKDGRFGPYVTDGETNASLRKGDDVLSITDERAAELLADRRARGPVKRTKKARQEGAGEEGPPRRLSARRASCARRLVTSPTSLGDTRFSGRASWVGAVRPRSSTISPTSQHSASASSAPLTAIADASTWPCSSLASSVRRAASLTGSPMTVYSNRACAPMCPAMARPAETPIPNSVSPRTRDQVVVQLTRRGQRGTAGVGMLDRRAEDAQRRVTLELVDEPAVTVDGVDDNAEELVEQADDVGGGDGRRELCRPDQVDEKHCDVALLAAELGAALQGAAGHVLTDVAAEQVTQPLPLGEFAHHVVESGLQQTQFAGVVDLHVRVVVTPLHFAKGPTQLAQRVGDRHRDQHGAEQADHQCGDGQQQDRCGETVGGRGENLDLAGDHRQHDRQDRHGGGQHPGQHLALNHARRAEVLRHAAAQGGDRHRPQHPFGLQIADDRRRGRAERGGDRNDRRGLAGDRPAGDDEDDGAQAASSSR